MSKSDASIPQPENRGVDRVFRSKKELMLANMLGGIAWGLGSVLGATIVVASLIYLLDVLGGIPVIGQYIHELQQSITSGSGQ